MAPYCGGFQLLSWRLCLPTLTAISLGLTVLSPLLVTAALAAAASATAREERVDCGHDTLFPGAQRRGAQPPTSHCQEGQGRH